MRYEQAIHKKIQLEYFARNGKGFALFLIWSMKIQTLLWQIHEDSHSTLATEPWLLQVHRQRRLAEGERASGLIVAKLLNQRKLLLLDFFEGIILLAVPAISGSGSG